jgi:hypothetical protein
VTTVKQAAESAEQKLPDGAVRISLSRPIQIPPANGEVGLKTLDTLTFREPTAEDIEIAGCPISIDADHRGEPKVVFDEQKMNAMLARLSGVQLPFIRKMRARDWTNCAWAISPFFVPGATT